MYFTVFLLIWLALPVVGLWPITVKTSHGWYNNALYMGIQDRTTVSESTHLCAYAEEITEWYIKSLCFGLMILPFALLVAGWDPLLNFSALMLLQVLPILTKIPVVTRMVEYVGKAANIAVMPREVPGSANRLIRHYPEFKEMDVNTVAKGIERALPVGKFLVWLLGYNIRKNT